VFGINECGVLTALARGDRFGIIAITAKSIARHQLWTRESKGRQGGAGRRKIKGRRWGAKCRRNPSRQKAGWSQGDRSEAEDTTCRAEANATDDEGKMTLCARASSTFGAAQIALLS
jgi:hypothetical protein